MPSRDIIDQSSAERLEEPAYAGVFPPVDVQLAAGRPKIERPPYRVLAEPVDAPAPVRLDIGHADELILYGLTY